MLRLKKQRKVKSVLKCGDCLDLFKTVPDKSVDLVLCDLPYGDTHNTWDKTIPIEPLFAEYKRVIKDNGAVILFAQNAFMGELISKNPKFFRYNLVWNKVRVTGFLNARVAPMRKHEDILVFYKKAPTYNPQMELGGSPSHSRGSKRENVVSTDKGLTYGKYNHKTYSDSTNSNLKYPTSIITISNKVTANRNHPSEKPVELMEYLIKTYTNEGDVVLDNAMGSGTVGVACKHLNRAFIGFELLDEYFKVAQKRIVEE